MASLVFAAEDLAPIPRRLPPPGIKLSDADRQRLESSVSSVSKRLAKLETPPGQDYRADVGVYLKAVDFALRHGEIYHAREIDWAEAHLKRATQRLDALAAGKRPWASKRGLVVRGYRSRLDDSYQPYGLVIPEKLDLSKPVPLYVWLHGRGDRIPDLQFIHRRQTSVGHIAPKDAIVLHPFGRYCNAFKLAGEVDVFEAIEAVKRNYKIDPDRVVLWGFSMGGAGAWHLGAHHPDRWVAMSPGAGFAETRRYQNIQPKDYPPTFEQTLWNLFDVPSYTRNLFNLPVVAYSGEKDKQIQAARVMEEAFTEHGRKLYHIIGPGMGHAYHPKSLAKISRLMAGHVERGIDRFPKTVHLQTRTLRYNRCHWVEILRLKQHWQDSRVDASVVDDNNLKLTTRNITALRLTSPWKGRREFPASVRVTIDGQTLSAAAAPSLTLVKESDRWQLAKRYPPNDSLRKLPGLQGPIDDVFMEPFLVVPPDGENGAHANVGKWVSFEQAHFQSRWRELFRGEPRVFKPGRDDEKALRRYHLVLWGDPKSNRLLAKLLQSAKPSWPLKWTADELSIGVRKFDPAHHVPVMIFPNPLNPKKYVVLNSGMTFREGHDRTNSLQNPKLPDWAVIDIRTPPDALQPGKIAAAGFFDEKWRVKKRAEGQRQKKGAKGQRHRGAKGEGR